MKVVEVFGSPAYVFHVHSSRSEASMVTRLHRLALGHPGLNNAATLAVLRSVRGLGRVLGVTK